jgi:hypothetical protein
MVQLFQIMAVVLAGVAAFFFWQNNSDWAFASGVLAVCSFFLSIRYQYKTRIQVRQAADVAEDDEEGDEPNTTQ